MKHLKNIILLIAMIGAIYIWGVFLVPDIADDIAAKIGIIDINNSLRGYKSELDSVSTDDKTTIGKTITTINSAKKTVDETLTSTKTTIDTIRKTASDAEQTYEKVSKDIESVSENIKTVENNIKEVKDRIDTIQNITN